MIEIIREAALGSIHSVYSIAIIIIPVMIGMQILKDYKVLDKITGPFRFLSTLFKTSNEAVLPLLVGIIFGISYGAGVIIQSAKEGNLNRRDLFLITIFLVSCHAVFEDTMIFVAVGANGFVLITLRVLAAFVLTYIFSRTSVIKEVNSPEEVEEVTV